MVSGAELRDHRDDLEGEELILERDRYGQEYPVSCVQTVQVDTCPAAALMRMVLCMRRDRR